MFYFFSLIRTAFLSVYKNIDCMFLSCHVRVSLWSHTLKLPECFKILSYFFQNVAWMFQNICQNIFLFFSLLRNRIFYFFFVLVYIKWLIVNIVQKTSMISIRAIMKNSERLVWNVQKLGPDQLENKTNV